MGSVATVELRVRNVCFLHERKVLTCAGDVGRLRYNRLDASALITDGFDPNWAKGLGHAR